MITLFFFILFFHNAYAAEQATDAQIDCNKYRSRETNVCLDAKIFEGQSKDFHYDKFRNKGKDAVLLSPIADKKLLENRKKKDEVAKTLSRLESDAGANYYSNHVQQLYMLLKHEDKLKKQFNLALKYPQMRAEISSELKVLQADKAALLMAEPLIGTQVMEEQLLELIKHDRPLASEQALKLFKQGLNEVDAFLDERNAQVHELKSKLNVVMLAENNRRGRGHSRVNRGYLSSYGSSLNIVDYILGHDSDLSLIENSDDKYRMCQILKERNHLLQEQDRNRMLLTVAVNVAPLFLGPGAGLVTKGSSLLARALNWGSKAAVFAVAEGSLLLLDYVEMDQKKNECLSLKSDLLFLDGMTAKDQAYQERLKKVVQCNEELANLILGFKTSIVISGLTIKDPLQLAKSIKEFRVKRVFDEFHGLKLIAGEDFSSKLYLAEMVSDLRLQGISDADIEKRFTELWNNPQKIPKHCVK